MISIALKFGVKIYKPRLIMAHGQYLKAWAWLNIYDSHSHRYFRAKFSEYVNKFGP